MTDNGQADVMTDGRQAAQHNMIFQAYKHRRSKIRTFVTKLPLNVTTHNMNVNFRVSICIILEIKMILRTLKKFRKVVNKVITRAITFAHLQLYIQKGNVYFLELERTVTHYTMQHTYILLDIEFKSVLSTFILL